MNRFGIAADTQMSMRQGIRPGAPEREGESGGAVPLTVLADKNSSSVDPGDGENDRAAWTPLQRMLAEILDPILLPRRSIREWRRLYRSFFTFFAPDGAASDTERRAWTLATETFNTNLIAVCNRRTQIVPMTFQDFVDGVDSFRHDGLREGAQRDIAWQPKKILLLMAAMIGRITAGWQADAGWKPQEGENLVSFRDYLIEENRKAKFLGHVFAYDPRFSMLDYPAAGLKPTVRAFPHFAVALTEKGIFRCELCLGQLFATPPRLCAHFHRALRLPVTQEMVSTLDFALLQGSASPGDTSRRVETEHTGSESGGISPHSLTFEPTTDPETRCSKVETLFELAVKGDLLVGASFRADASTAQQIGKVLGRTRAERFAIERFFALGFRSGQGNEPWLEHASNPAAAPATTQLKKARRQFSRWMKTRLFFSRAGHPQAGEVPGADIRAESLQPRDSSLFLSLLGEVVYAPLLGLFLSTDTQGRWLADEQELHAFATALHGGAGRVLAEAGGTINRMVATLQDPQRQGIFLLECALGILLTTSGRQEPRQMQALRHHYEESMGISLSAAPSVLSVERRSRDLLMSENKTQCQVAERTAMKLLAEPLNRRLAAQLQTIVEALPRSEAAPPDTPESSVPRIRLENREKFEVSIAQLANWLEMKLKPAGGGCSSDRQFLEACVELRSLAEQGKTEEALPKSIALYADLSLPRKQAFGPFIRELTWSLLQAIEWHFDQGNPEKAMGLAEATSRMIQGTHFSNDFEDMFRSLLASKSPMPKPGGAVGGRTSALQTARGQQAEALLHHYADELGMTENQLEREFLQAVKDGSEAAFKRKEKLKNRLQRQTRWGGREPYKTTLRLLESIPVE